MSSSNSISDLHVPFIGDASVIINLVATGCASEIIRALGHPFVVTENACDELEEGASKGHNDYGELKKWIDARIVIRAKLSETALITYERLVDGASARTLDDGEAATIAHADDVSAIPLLDERKARSICAASFPTLKVLCSAELLMNPTLTSRFGSQGQIDLIVNALKVGRMRVPAEHVAKIRDIIGEENAAQCPSLPRIARAWTRPPKP